MKYRQFGKRKNQVSVLGFGCMRFPMTQGETPVIDEKQTFDMLKFAIDQGVNYFDTAYGYHGGESELVLGRFFQQTGLRDSVYLATKLPPWQVKTADDFDRLLNEQLSKLHTNRIDYYLLHALGASEWKKIYELGVLDWAEKAIADGRVGELGFSFHDEYEVYVEILNAYDWSFTQLQYNYIDIEEQAGAKGVALTAAKGMSVVAMEPLLGGKLAIQPESVARTWRSSKENHSPAEWALNWLWDQKEVNVVLSGMSSTEQVQQNVVSAEKAEVGMINEADRGLFDTVRAAYKELMPIPCTQCQYCMPCTVDLDIPGLFQLYNSAKAFGSLGESRWWYGTFEEGKKASACIDCDDCEPKCPQQIVISEWMPKVQAVLGEGKDFSD